MEVRFYATLRALVGAKHVEVALPAGATVLDLAEELARRWPPLREHLFDDEGAISRRVSFFLDGRNLRWLPEGAATVLLDGVSVDVFPPVAGG